MTVSKKVIVIEEDDDILFILNLILEESGYTVFTSSTTNLFSDLNIVKPDLLLLDDTMHGTSGSKICKAIKTNPSTKRYPVVLVSARPDLSVVACECFADDYIEKPFDIDEFCRRLERINTGDINAN